MIQLYFAQVTLLNLLKEIYRNVLTKQSFGMVVTSYLLIPANQVLCCCVQNEISLNNMALPQVKSTKYLGLYIDENLSWNIHINFLIKRMSRKLQLFRRLNKFRPKATIIKIYSAYIQPLLEYACSVWGTCTKESLMKLQKIQNMAARIIFDNYDFINISGLDLLSHLDGKLFQTDINILFLQLCLNAYMEKHQRIYVITF